jgi:hypothetical protein
LGDFSKNKPQKAQFSKPLLFSACYEGTQSQAVMRFRTDSTFDLHWSAAFGNNNWWQGNFSQKADTIALKYNSEINEQIGQKPLLKKDRIIPIVKDSYREFTIGGCLGNN